MEQATDKKGHGGWTSWFSPFARLAATWCGYPSAFLLAVAVVVVWAVSGPIFGYSEDWQLVINTGTTIITFLMVFLIQNTQNRDMCSSRCPTDGLKSTPLLP